MLIDRIQADLIYPGFRKVFIKYSRKVEKKLSGI